MLKKITNYENDIEKLIKKYVDESPETFFSIPTHSTKPLQEPIRLGNYRQTPLYKRIKTFLSKLIQCTYLDYYHEKKFKDLLYDKNASFDIDTEEKFKKDFKRTFKILTDKWLKFPKSHEKSVTTNFKYKSCTIPSSRNYDFSWEIFKVIYSKYPQLCEKIFPVVLFIIADFYYEFCKICYIKNEGQNLPDTPSPADKEKILDTFEKIIYGEGHDAYLFSLLDKKAKYYNESSFSYGEKIYNEHKEDYRKKYKWVEDKYKTSESTKIMDEQCNYINGFTEENDVYYQRTFEINMRRDERAFDEVIQDMDSENKTNEAMERIKSSYKNRLSQKQKDRSEYLADTPIVLGENFHAVQYLLDEFKSNNAWKNYDLPLTLYSINRVTGWYDALFLSSVIYKTKEIQSAKKRY